MGNIEALILKTELSSYSSYLYFNMENIKPLNHIEPIRLKFQIEPALTVSVYMRHSTLPYQKDNEYDTARFTMWCEKEGFRWLRIPTFHSKTCIDFQCRLFNNKSVSNLHTPRHHINREKPAHWQLCYCSRMSWGLEVKLTSQTKSIFSGLTMVPSKSQTVNSATSGRILCQLKETLFSFLGELAISMVSMSD